MRVFKDSQNLPKFKNAVVTIGSFDGVHHGHQQIIRQINDLAQSVDGESILVTFHPHPRQVIYPKDNSLRLLSTLEEKIALLEKYGVDNLVIVPFTFEFSRQTPEEYIERFLVDKFQPHTIVIGYDHKFGLNRQGDIYFLQSYGEKHSFRIREIEKQEIKEVAVSSTKVRQAIEAGKVKTAARLLNHHYHLTGKVVHGQRIGSTIGFPTANIDIQDTHKLLPPDGIYAATVQYNNQQYGAMLYLGYRPSIHGHDNHTIEVNIFDFKEDIYGKNISVELIERIRGDQKFHSLEGLKKQLFEDKKATQKILAEEKDFFFELNKKVTPSVAVVILNYNTQHQLTEFLPTLLKTTEDNVEIVVADNGSSDDSLEYLRTNFQEQITILDLKENHGFTGGYNRALAQVEADYFVLLNSDVAVTENWLPPIIDLMEKDTTIAAAQPKILAQQRPTHFEYAGAAGGYMDYWGYPFCRGRIFDMVEEDRGQYDQTMEVFWATGAAMFVRAKLFLKIGGFDDRFFAHMEEIDLCWRLKRAGYKIMAVPESVVYHVGGGTLDYQSPFKTFLNFRNNYFLLTKNLPTATLLWLIPWRLLLDGVAAILFLAEGKWRHIWSIVKAHWAFFGSFGQTWKSRKEAKKRIQNNTIEEDRTKIGRLRKSVVFAFYLQGKRLFSEVY